MARTYFNDVDEEFFRAGEDITDQRARRSYSDLQEYDGFAPGVLRRAVDRLVRARRALVLAGVFLAGAVVGFAIATWSSGAPAPAAVALPGAAPLPAASPAPAPPTVAPLAQPAVAPVVSPTAARPAAEPVVARPAAEPVVARPAAEPVVARPAAETAGKPIAKSATPTRRRVSRGGPKARLRRSTPAPVFPYQD